MTTKPWFLLTRFLLTILPVLVLTSPAGAQYVPGSGQLFAKDKVKAKGCGRVKLAGPQMLRLEANGTWMATDESGLFTGTYVPFGSTGRKFDLDFDGPSLVLFRLMLEEELSELCQALVLVTAVESKRFRLTLNPSGSNARLKAKFDLLGTANGHPGKASFNAVAKGPWTLAP
jgi:hypothetical protein